jgi:hypothetical protein
VNVPPHGLAKFKVFEFEDEKSKTEPLENGHKLLKGNLTVEFLGYD